MFISSLKSARVLGNEEVNDFEIVTESEHRKEFIRFLREIPHDFMAVAQSPKKKELIRNHLRAFYKSDPRDKDIQTVLERVTNLAMLTKVGRKNFENRSAQASYKNAQWNVEKRCAICGLGFTRSDDATLDHILPLCFGGAENKVNWQLTCYLCNQQKKNLWGASDIARGESINRFQNGFFKLTGEEFFHQLRAPNNPTRYWVFERDGRKCSECPATAKEEKIYVAVDDQRFLLTVDNLKTYCFDCVKHHANYSE
jgi:5-methylcytosine-specific restriction endonuclease McrA